MMLAVIALVFGLAIGFVVGRIRGYGAGWADAWELSRALLIRERRPTPELIRAARVAREQRTKS